MKKINLTIGGKNYTYWFGLGFIGELLDETGLDIQEVFSKVQKNPFKYLPKMMYLSAKYGANREGKEFEPKNEFYFVDLIEVEGGFTAIGEGNVKAFLEAFILSITKDVPIEDEPQKKRVQKSKKEPEMK